MNTFDADTVLGVVQIIQRRGASPVVVGIDGPGGAGKSTLARRLEARLGGSGLAGSVAVVQGDDFYSDTTAVQKAELSAREGVDQYFDWRRLRREVLLPASAAADTLSYRRYDWDHETLGDQVEIPMPAVVIVEGVYTLRPELRDLVHVKIWVETTRDLRLRRQRDRAENSDDWIARWTAAEDAYVAAHDPTAIMDVVVINGG